MRMIQEVEIAGRKIQVKEMTVGEVRALLAETEAADSTDTVGWLLFDDTSLHHLSAMTDLSQSDMNDFTPTQLRELADACKKANPHFFEMMERGMRIFGQLAPQTSNAPAASS